MACDGILESNEEVIAVIPCVFGRGQHDASYAGSAASTSG